MRWELLVSALLVAACGSADEISTVYDPCSPLTLSIAPDLGADERRGVDEAIALWTAVIPTRITVGTGPQAPDVLPVRFVTGEGMLRATYWDSAGVIEIGRDRLDPATYGIALAHELGHAFGLFHVDAGDRASVMNVGNLVVPPGATEAAELRALWPACDG